MKRVALAVALGMAIACSPYVATTTSAPSPVVTVNPAPSPAVMPVLLPPGAQWGPGPASLPAGARAVVIDGDPTKEGLFTMRLLLPDDYRVPPHSHAANEHITVISGVFHVGMGNTFTMAGAEELRQGSFKAIAPGMTHFAHAAGETVIQLHGMGPWRLTYVNPADDPRNR